MPKPWTIQRLERALARRGFELDSARHYEGQIVESRSDAGAPFLKARLPGTDVIVSADTPEQLVHEVDLFRTRRGLDDRRAGAEASPPAEPPGEAVLATGTDGRTYELFAETGESRLLERPREGART